MHVIGIKMKVPIVIITNVGISGDTRVPPKKVEKNRKVQ